MPSMIRPSNPKLKKRGRDIAFSILGIPPNLQKQKLTAYEEKMDQRLTQEELRYGR
jgi:hypothetical protein